MDEREFRACGRKRRYETRIDAKKAAERSSRRKDAPSARTAAAGTSRTAARAVESKVGYFFAGSRSTTASVPFFYLR